MRIDFNGAVAFVTGAGSGIGLACARALRASGARIVAADRDVGAADRIAAELGGLPIEMDVTREDEVIAGLDRAEAALGPVSVVVTAAGILQRPQAPEALRLAEWDRVLATNLRGTYLVAARAGARMAARGKGAIVTISSVMGVTPGALHAYGPAKAGVIALTQSLAAEWGAAGVRVNGVAPGFTETPALSRALAFRVLDQDVLAAGAAQGRVIGAEEVAAAVAFLASDAASAITGATLPVDGGYLASAGLRSFGRVPRDGEA
jgi:NAD(P)-dependent dehydrogenase (short-subunit alcohol dehydrogenase family)